MATYKEDKSGCPFVYRVGAVTKVVDGDTLDCVFDILKLHNVMLEGIVLKPNMVISGSDARERASAADVAQQTVECLLENVPSDIPGIAFLSGGQEDEESVVNLDEINKIAGEAVPWELTYSFGRALQAAPLAAWLGLSDRVQVAQAAFEVRMVECSAAREGDLDMKRMSRA